MCACGMHLDPADPAHCSMVAVTCVVGVGLVQADVVSLHNSRGIQQELPMWPAVMTAMSSVSIQCVVEHMQHTVDATCAVPRVASIGMCCCWDLLDCRACFPLLAQVCAVVGHYERFCAGASGSLCLEPCRT